MKTCYNNLNVVTPAGVNTPAAVNTARGIYKN